MDPFRLKIQTAASECGCRPFFEVPYSPASLNPQTRKNRHRECFQRWKADAKVEIREVYRNSSWFGMQMSIMQGLFVRRMVFTFRGVRKKPRLFNWLVLLKRREISEHVSVGSNKYILKSEVFPMAIPTITIILEAGHYCFLQL